MWSWSSSPRGSLHEALASARAAAREGRSDDGLRGLGQSEAMIELRELRREALHELRDARRAAHAGPGNADRGPSAERRAAAEERREMARERAAERRGPGRGHR